MPPFANEFSWSPSRHRMFEDCRRRYYYNYYGSWGGWNIDADPESRLLYQLKKMTTIPQLTGTVVHDAISHVLKAFQAGREMPPKAVVAYGVGLLNRHLKDSEQKRWQKSPSRHTNLFEHYYNTAFDPEETRNRIIDCINAFLDTDACSALRDLPSQQWLSIEQLTSFLFHDTKLWVALDVAVRQNGVICIYDWKTGRERSADRLQLAVYALYADAAYQALPSDLQLQDVYLQAGEARAVPIDDDILTDTRQAITDSITQMHAHLDDPTANTATRESFLMIDDQKACRTCSFKAVCHPIDTSAQNQPTEQQDPVQLSLF